MGSRVVWGARGCQGFGGPGVGLDVCWSRRARSRVRYRRVRGVRVIKTSVVFFSCALAQRDAFHLPRLAGFMVSGLIMVQASRLTTLILGCTCRMYLSTLVVARVITWPGFRGWGVGNIPSKGLCV